MKKDLFRSDALHQLRDPQQLDTTLKLVSPASWLALATFGVIVVAFIAWCFLGTIPFRAQGLGIALKQGSTVYEMTAPTAAEVAAVDVTVGQQVKKGDRLVLLRLPDMEARRITAQTRVVTLETQRKKQATFIKRNIVSRRQNTEAQIRALEAKVQTLQERERYLEEQLSIKARELAKGYITSQEHDVTRTQFHEVTQGIRDSRVAIAQQRAQQTEFENSREQELAQLDEKVLEAHGELREVEATVETEKAIYSPVDGVVTEIATKPGVLVAPAVELVEIEGHGTGLLAYAYLPVAQGKRVTPGMPAQISPTSIERDIYGSIIGKVRSVSAMPVTGAVLDNKFGDPKLTEEMLAGGPPIEIEIELMRDPATVSGLAWSSSSGPPVRITSGTTVLISIIIQEIPPVDLIVPIYKTWIAGKRP